MEYILNTQNKTIRFISGNVNELSEIIAKYPDYNIISQPQYTVTTYPSYPLQPYYQQLPLTVDCNSITTADCNGQIYFASHN